jgi:hypothetical protein
LLATPGGLFLGALQAAARFASIVLLLRFQRLVDMGFRRDPQAIDDFCFKIFLTPGSQHKAICSQRF